MHYGRLGSGLLMRVDVISLFPEWIAQLRDYGVVGRGIRERQLQLQTWNPRDYSKDRNRRVDDRSFGGGPGMVMQVEPLQDALAAIGAARGAVSRPTVIMLSPQGERFDQRWAQALAERDDGFVLLCGRRSEEHTSELQSRGHLVCRLLLEK